MTLAFNIDIAAGVQGNSAIFIVAGAAQECVPLKDTIAV
jgi:hypothetical protein